MYGNIIDEQIKWLCDTQNHLYVFNIHMLNECWNILRIGTYMEQVISKKCSTKVINIGKYLIINIRNI